MKRASMNDGRDRIRKALATYLVLVDRVKDSDPQAAERFKKRWTAYSHRVAGRTWRRKDLFLQGR